MTAHLPDGLSPDAVDTLTELSAIITKLRSAQQIPSTVAVQGVTATAATTTPSGGPGTSTPAPTLATLAPPTGSTPAATAASHTSSGGPLLSAKDVPAATDNLKHKLQRARAAMRTLADVQRTIAQQEAEMARLEERRQRQARMLARTQEEGLRFVRVEGGLGGGDGLGEEGQRIAVEEGDRMVVE